MRIYGSIIVKIYNYCLIWAKGLLFVKKEGYIYELLKLRT